jgi:hypothetical protein
MSQATPPGGAASTPISERARALHREGDAHYAAGRFEAAIASFQAALAETPESLPLRFNIGNALRNRGRPREAIAAYDAALALAPGFAMARHNRATCLLHIGDLAQGFREYEWRKACPGFVDDPRYALPRPWRGEDLAGKTLHIYPELFQGDLIQFGRYALFAQQIGAKVVLGAPRPLHALLQTMSPSLGLVDAEAPTPDYDFQSAMMSLPAIFGTTLATVPAPARYLGVEAQRYARWRQHIGATGLKIGLVWQGSAQATQRSFPLAVAARALAGLPGVRLISLQKINGLDQLSALPPGTVEDLGPGFDPGPDLFVDTAAAMACCDLVICPDTSALHVAGGLGRPTWLVLPQPGDWRWLEDRADTPWYPSVRIFRQPQPGDWAGAFGQVRATLSRLRPDAV